MNRENEIRYKKILKQQLEKGAIKKSKYKKEMKWIKELKTKN